MTREGTLFNLGTKKKLIRHTRSQHKMKILIYLLSLFIINTYAQEQSDLMTDQEKSHGSGINAELKQNLKIIEVNDQTFYGLFTDHLSNEPRDYILETIPFLSNPNYREKAIKALRHVLISYADIVESEKSDIVIIAELLQSSDIHLQWIGIEESENEIKEAPVPLLVKQYLKFKDFFSQEEMNDLLYLIFDNHIIALAEYPELFKGIDFIPLDDDLHKKVSTGEVIVTTLEKMYEIMPQKATELDDMVSIAITNTTKIQEQSELNKIENPEIKALAVTLFEHTNQYIEEVWQRDKTMASTALKQSGNGLILLGPLHLKEVTQYLLSAKKN